MKVLISAYACQPGMGSEPGVGWNVVEQVAKQHDVWVLTRANNRAAIEAALRARPMPRVRFCYLDVLGWSRRWRPQQVGRTVRLHYYLWQLRAYAAARRLQRAVGFDVCHHVTYVQYAAPSLLALLPVPFVWGPVGGGESAPASFHRSFGRRGRRYERLRDLSRRLAERDPLVGLTARRCALALAMTPDTAARLRALGARRIEPLSESGMRSEEIAALAALPMPAPPPLRFVSIGRLLHWKGFYLGLEAFAAAQLPAAEYWILGAGPERRRLEEIARAHGLGERVRLRGHLPRQAALAALAECHVLVHPSLHDSGGWVCLEAMAAGRPVLCLNLGGPAVQVTEKTGVRISAVTPDQVIRDLADEMRRFADNPELLMTMGAAGRERIRTEFDWNIKGQYLVNIYRKVSAGAASVGAKEPVRCAS